MGRRRWEEEVGRRWGRWGGGGGGGGGGEEEVGRRRWGGGGGEEQVGEERWERRGWVWGERLFTINRDVMERAEVWSE